MTLYENLNEAKAKYKLETGNVYKTPMGDIITITSGVDNGERLTYTIFHPKTGETAKEWNHYKKMVANPGKWDILNESKVNEAMSVPQLEKLIKGTIKKYWKTTDNASKLWKRDSETKQDMQDMIEDELNLVGWDAETVKILNNLLENLNESSSIKIPGFREITDYDLGEWLFDGDVGYLRMNSKSSIQKMYDKNPDNLHNLIYKAIEEATGKKLKITPEVKDFVEHYAAGIIKSNNF